MEQKPNKTWIPRHRIISLGVAFVLIFAGTWGQLQGKSSGGKITQEEATDLFYQVLQYVKNDYVEEVSSDELMFGAIRGMLAATGDEHTRFMDPEQYKELQVDTTGKFGGLGIEISIRDNTLTVVSPIEDTPAMRAGLKPGDKIVEIEKESTHGVSINDAVKKLRGEPGTKVNISVVREGIDEVLYYTIVRDIIRIEVVASTIIPNTNIGYVRLKQFSQTAPSEIRSILEDFKKKNVKAVILDLRWNPGGLLDAAVEISNLFVKEGVLVSTRGRKSAGDRVFRADPRKVVLPNTPLVILANEGSASASEIVTGAVKDHKRGIFIGTKTFGKGSVQSVIPLNYDTAIALTIQKYYTPSDVSIHKKGIEPDVEVKPLEFTKEDQRNYSILREKEILQNFVKTHKEYNEKNIQLYKVEIEKANLPLSDFALKQSLRQETYNGDKRPVIDLEFDVQLQKAIEHLKKKG